MATGTVVNSFKEHLLSLANTDATSLKIMLLDGNHSQDIDTQEFIDDVSANEVNGTGYTAGGQAISNPSVSVDNTSNQGEFDFDDVVWDASGGSLTAQWAILYDDTGTPGTSRIWAQYDEGSEITATDDNYTFSPSDADGGMYIS